MNKINWKQKLASRKFWAAIISVIVALAAVFKIPEVTVEQIVAVVTAISALIAYIVGEGLVDAARLRHGDVEDDQDEDGENNKTADR